MSLLQSADAMGVSAGRAEFDCADSVAIAKSTGPAGYRLKRVFDISSALLLLLFSAPVMIAIWIVLVCTGGKPVFSQRRVGQGGRMFRCFKFRTMVNDANQMLT